MWFVVPLAFVALLPYHCLALTASSSSSLPTNTKPRVTFRGLDESSFRHPLDRDLTSLIQTLPGGSFAEEALRRSFPIIEQGVRLDLLSSSVKVSPQQLPQLHGLLLEACRVLDLEEEEDDDGDAKGERTKTKRPIPELYVQSNPQANAYTLALRGRDTPPIVVVTSALLDRCTEREIQAIIGHELGHLKCEHSLYLTLGGLASTPIRNLPLVGSSVDSILQRWRLAAEYTCDRAAMLVAQDSNVVAGALLKLFAGTNKYDMSTEAFIAQCVEYDELLKNANPFVRSSIQQQQRTHPLPVRRVAELQEWAKSENYTNILKRGIQLQNSSRDGGKNEL